MSRVESDRRQTSAPAKCFALLNLNRYKEERRREIITDGNNDVKTAYVEYLAIQSEQAAFPF